MVKQLDSNYRRASGWSSMAALLLALAVMVLPGAGFAHILNVFAWVDGDEVVVEGKFNSGKRPVGGEVRVLDGYDKLLLTTELQKDGTVRLPLPDDYSSGLKIELSTSFGHDSYWILTPNDIESQRAKSKDGEDKGDNSDAEQSQNEENKPTVSKTEDGNDSDVEKSQHKKDKSAKLKDGKYPCEKHH